MSQLNHRVEIDHSSMRRPVHMYAFLSKVDVARDLLVKAYSIIKTAIVHTWSDV